MGLKGRSGAKSPSSAGSASPGSTSAQLEELSFWASEECADKLERSLVSRACLEAWAALPPFPADHPEWHEKLCMSRKFYLTLLQRGNHKTFHDSFSKACCLLDVTVRALLEAGSPLLDDIVLVTTLVLGISRKDETSAATGCDQDLLRLCLVLEDHLGLPAKERTVKELKFAEMDILELIDWNLPQTDTYKCISAMLLRTDILTRGQYKPQLERAWQSVVQKCIRAVLVGQASGYQTAYRVVRDGLTEVGLPESYVEHLMGVVSPCPGDPPSTQSKPYWCN